MTNCGKASEVLCAEGGQPSGSELILATDDHEVFLACGTSDYTLVMFGPAGAQCDGRNFWGKSLVEKLGIAAIGIMSRRPEWYPESTMRQVLPYIKALIPKGRKVVTYGTSMGAYGALKYGAELGASCTIAFSPQDTIDPAVVGERHPNSRSFQRHINAGMEIRGSDCPGLTFLFYDPYVWWDRLHADRLSNILPRLRQIRLPFAGHEAVRVFADSESAGSLLRLCLADDAAGLRSLANRARRLSSRWPLNCAYACLDRKPHVAARLSGDVEQSTSADAAMRFQLKLANGFLRVRDVASAEAALHRALQHRPDDAHALVRMVDFQTKNHGSRAAVPWVSRMLKAGPADAAAHRRAAEVFLACSMYAESEAALLRVAALGSEDADLLRGLSEVELGKGNRRGARLWAEKAVRVAPDQVKSWLQLGECLRRLGDHTGAQEAVTRAINIDPSNSLICRRLSDLALKSGSSETAVSWAERALSLAPGEAVALFQLGKALEAAGRLEEARAAYTAARDLKPKYQSDVDRVSGR